MWPKGSVCWSHWWMSSVSTHFAGQKFHWEVGKCYPTPKCSHVLLRRGLSLYSYRTSAPEASKSVFFFIKDVTPVSFDFLIWARSTLMHTLFVCLPRQDSDPCLPATLMIITGCSVEEARTWMVLSTQSEDSVPISQTTWVVMHHQKAGRLVWAAPCKFTCLAVGWKYCFIEPVRLEVKSDPKLLHSNAYFTLFWTIWRVLLLLFPLKTWGDVGPVLKFPFGLVFLGGRGEC